MNRPAPAVPRSAQYNLRTCACFFGLILSTNAEIEKWTDKSGRAVEMELLSTSESHGTISGEFRMKDGQIVSVPSSKFADSDAKKIADWKGASTGATFYLVAAPELDPFGKESETKLDYFFSINNPRIIGIKNDSIRSISSSLSNIYKIDGWEASSLPVKNVKKSAWVLWNGGGGGGVFCNHYIREENIPPSVLDIRFSLLNEKINGVVNGGKSFTSDQAEASSFSAEIVVATSVKTKQEILKFSPNEIGWLPDGIEKQPGKMVGTSRIRLLEVPDDIFASEPEKQPRYLDVSINDLYNPCCVRSIRILSGGKPIKRLSEAASDITMIVNYWTDIKEMNVMCEKKSADRSAHLRSSKDSGEGDKESDQRE